ncbi:BLUF domain-containing protein [Glycocaulis sp.]|uniref:BLUF domain-containing protein n=1 Tax=Glycocaulis sp. TaxID=1969725 RepID=UPI003D258C12
MTREPWRRRLRLEGTPCPGEAAVLTRLVYISAVAIARGQGHFRSELADIMAACERYNPRAGITGVLVYDRGRFIQMLEGPKAAVEDIYARICNDTRHAEVTLLLNEPASERLFDDWAMAFANAGDAPLPVKASSGWVELDRDGLLSRLREIHDHQAVMNLRSIQPSP